MVNIILKKEKKSNRISVINNSVHVILWILYNPQQKAQGKKKKKGGGGGGGGGEGMGRGGEGAGEKLEKR